MTFHREHVLETRKRVHFSKVYFLSASGGSFSSDVLLPAAIIGRSPNGRFYPSPLSLSNRTAT